MKPLMNRRGNVSLEGGVACRRKMNHCELIKVVVATIPMSHICLFTYEEHCHLVILNRKIFDMIIKPQSKARYKCNKS